MNQATQRLLDRINQLGAISNSPDCLSRYYGTPAFEKAGNLLNEWMIEAGLIVTKDCVGNIRGILHSQDSNAKHFVVGSHYDSVHNAGKYDGPLGILMGIELAIHCKEKELALPFHLNVVAFADEEGARFNTSYLGSSVLAGNFNMEWLDHKDDDGICIKELIEKEGNVASIPNYAIPKKDWLGYFEIHIEQGPVLEDKGQSVCSVKSIAGQDRLTISWEGMAGHAGTSPMGLRKDAYCGAAEFALVVEQTALSNKDKLVATVGKLNLFPNTSNVIPEKVTHTLDIRSADQAFLKIIVNQLETLAKEIASKRELKMTWELVQANPPVACDEELTHALNEAISSIGVNPINLLSGAGHDGVMIAEVAPITMLFVRSKAGISHNPLEHSSPEDIQDAIEVSIKYLENLILAIAAK
jgi:allantoate deiminase